MSKRAKETRRIRETKSKLVSDTAYTYIMGTDVNFETNLSINV